MTDEPYLPMGLLLQYNNFIGGGGGGYRYVRSLFLNLAATQEHNWNATQPYSAKKCMKSIVK